MTFVDVGAFYRVAGPLEALVGARYASLDVTAELTGLGAESAEAGWWNVFVGARARHRFDDRWSGVLYADGGFGESESNFLTQGVVQYRFANHWLVDVGFKWLHDRVEGESSVADWDYDMYGALVGVTYRFE